MGGTQSRWSVQRQAAAMNRSDDDGDNDADDGGRRSASRPKGAARAKDGKDSAAAADADASDAASAADVDVVDDDEDDWRGPDGVRCVPVALRISLT